MRCLILGCLLVAAGCQQAEVVECAPGALTFDASALDESDLERLAEAPKRNMDRQLLAETYLSELDCDLSRQRIASTRFHNLICDRHGEKDSPHIVVGAHYDRTGGGQGVADNWSGVVLMRRLAMDLIRLAPEARVSFVAFGEEETGLKGTLQYLQKLPELPDAMVNVDTIGIRALAVDQRSDPEFLCLAESVAGSLGIELSNNALPQTVGDWAPFKRRGVPVLNFHSLHKRDLLRIHTRRDNVSLIDKPRLTEAYRVILNTMLNLVARLPAET